MLLIPAILLSTVGFGQILLNEISPTNGNILPDEDGDYPDWIELYNAGGSTREYCGIWYHR